MYLAIECLFVYRKHITSFVRSLTRSFHLMLSAASVYVFFGFTERMMVFVLPFSCACVRVCVCSGVYVSVHLKWRVK